MQNTIMLEKEKKETVRQLEKLGYSTYVEGSYPRTAEWVATNEPQAVAWKLAGVWYLASVYSRSSVEEQEKVTAALRAEVEAKEAAKEAAQAEAEALERAIEETALLLMQLYPDDCVRYTQGRYSNPLIEEVWERFPSGKACFLGGVTSGVVSGVYGNSGEEWSYYDLHSRRVVGQWHLATAYSCSSVKEQEAVVASLRAEVEAKETAREKAAQEYAASRERLLDQQAAYRKEWRESRRRRLQGQVADEAPPPPPQPQRSSGPLNGLGAAFDAIGL